MPDPRKIAVVTGGTAGVGRATIRELARRGYDVAVLARGEDGLAATAAEIRAAGRRALTVPTDVADHDQVDAAAGRVENELGPIDVWVNNAFTGSIAFFGDITPKEFERITAVTYLGQVNGTRAALVRMRPRNRGTVVQVTSALAYQGIPLQSAYCGAKHAIVGFSQSVRIELRNQGSAVTISQVALPGLNTPQFDWELRRGIHHHPQPVAPIF
jgi:NAD(P)-dependent dehydrogenase (short-subunit alcohol dehydrogenase family)